ncbi:MAG: hypothetical protein ACO1TE_22330 [Prosthecobacter sp.]
MNRHTITEKCLEEGALAIVSQKSWMAIVMGLFAAVSLVAASVAWAFSGNDAHLTLGSWDLSLLFNLAIKAMAALIVAAATFGILHRTGTALARGYAKRMAESWAAKTGGAMTVQIEDNAIQCGAGKGAPLFRCHDITGVIRSKSHVVYVVCDKQQRMTAFLPLPLGARTFIEALNQHMRPEVRAQMGDLAGCSAMRR